MSLPISSPPGSSPCPDRKPILCYVTDRRSLQDAPQTDSFEPLLENIERVAAAGVNWIQLREKDLSGRSYTTLIRQALRRVSQQAAQATGSALTLPPTRILVNDRLDVAIAEHAGGFHLGENSIRIEDAKHLITALRSAQAVEATQPLPHDFLLGVSCHSLESAQSAASAGAGYIFFGPVFATPSKAAYGAPQGLNQLAQVCASLRIPVLAIGGITLENAPACLAAGASGIAAIRLFQASAGLSATVKALRSRL